MKHFPQMTHRVGEAVLTRVCVCNSVWAPVNRVPGSVRGVLVLAYEVCLEIGHHVGLLQCCALDGLVIATARGLVGASKQAAFNLNCELLTARVLR